jgi:glycosyltransferase involved in cell wall biosynthesis
MFLNTLYAPNLVGGAERVVQSLAEGAVDAGHQAVVVSLGEQKGVRSSWVNGVKVYYVGNRNLYWAFREGGAPVALKPLWHALDTYNPLMSREVASILNTDKPDLVHTHTLSGFSPLCWRPIKERGLPLVHTLHDYYLMCPKASMFRGGRNCQRRCSRCLPYSVPRAHHSNLVDVVTGVSDFVLKRHLDHGYFYKVPEKRVIYNGFEVGKLIGRAGQRTSPVRLGYLGRIDPTKGLEKLLDSAGKLPEGGWSLSIGGKGPVDYVKGLRARCGSSSVRFLGYVAAETFFEEIDALVVPSVWHEPSPRVISEAYAYGVPVIGSRRGGIPELVEEGRTGLLFDPDRPDDLTQKMRTFVADRALAESMSGACLEKAASLLPKNITAQYLDVYAGLAGGR